MKLYRTTTALALGVATASGPALAQDGSSRDTHFDGPYVSAVLGMSIQGNDGHDSILFDTNRDGVFGDTVTTTTGADAFSPGFCGGRAHGATRADGCRNDKDKLDYAIRGGYDKRVSNNFVVGGLFEVGMNDSTDSTSAFSVTPASYSIRRKMDYNLSLRARAGYTPGGGALFYVTGGGGIAKLKHRFETTNVVNSFDERRNGKMVWGWQVGGGSEIMLTNQISLGLEYLYNRYDDGKYRVEVGPGTAPPTNPFLLQSGGTDMRVSDKNFDYHSLRATVSYQF